jgi:formate/nitrite transporter FocA (FNT family)
MSLLLFSNPTTKIINTAFAGKGHYLFWVTLGKAISGSVFMAAAYNYASRFPA